MTTLVEHIEDAYNELPYCWHEAVTNLNLIEDFLLP